MRLLSGVGVSLKSTKFSFFVGNHRTLNCFTLFFHEIEQESLNFNNWRLDKFSRLYQTHRNSPVDDKWLGKCQTKTLTSPTGISMNENIHNHSQIASLKFSLDFAFFLLLSLKHSPDILSSQFTGKKDKQIVCGEKREEVKP